MFYPLGVERAIILLGLLRVRRRVLQLFIAKDCGTFEDGYGSGGVDSSGIESSLLLILLGKVKQYLTCVLRTIIVNDYRFQVLEIDWRNFAHRSCRPKRIE